MRIGEVAIISYKSYEKENFIRSICQKIDIKDEKLSFGRFEVNDQLALYFYGISFDYKKKPISWDLISRKTLGFIVIFDWDDKKTTWTEFYYNSGETVEASHTWNKWGTYEIRVKAKDPYGYESEWSDPLEVTMPRSKEANNYPFLNILERFPILYHL